MKFHVLPSVKLSRICFIYDVWFWFGYLCFIFAAIRRKILACWLLFKMAGVFNWFRPGYELVNVKLLWNVKVPFLETTDGNGEELLSPPFFFPKETQNKIWRLKVIDRSKQIRISMRNYNSAGDCVNFVEPVLVKMSILDRNRQKVFHQSSI